MDRDSLNLSIEFFLNGIHSKACYEKNWNRQKIGEDAEGNSIYQFKCSHCGTIVPESQLIQARDNGHSKPSVDYLAILENIKRMTL